MWKVGLEFTEPRSEKEESCAGQGQEAGTERQEMTGCWVLKDWGACRGRHTGILGVSGGGFGGSPSWSYPYSERQ